MPENLPEICQYCGEEMDIVDLLHLTGFKPWCNEFYWPSDEEHPQAPILVSFEAIVSCSPTTRVGLVE
jgi:hypothetical protein